MGEKHGAFGVCRGAKFRSGDRAKQRSYAWVEYAWTKQRGNQARKRVEFGLCRLSAELVDFDLIAGDENITPALVERYKVDCQGKPEGEIRRMLGAYGITSGIYFSQGGTVPWRNAGNGPEKRVNFSRETAAVYRANEKGLRAVLYRVLQGWRKVANGPKRGEIPDKVRESVGINLTKKATREILAEQGKVNSRKPNYASEQRQRELSEIASQKREILALWEEMGEQQTEEMADAIRLTLSGLNGRARLLLVQLGIVGPTDNATAQANSAYQMGPNPPMFTEGPAYAGDLPVVGMTDMEYARLCEQMMSENYDTGREEKERAFTISSPVVPPTPIAEEKDTLAQEIANATPIYTRED